MKWSEAKELVKSYKKVITIDVGVNTGWARFVKNELKDHGVLRYKKVKTNLSLLEHQIEIMSLKFEKEFCEMMHLKTTCVIIEGVSYWADSLKSEVASKTGALALLSYLTGAYASICRMYNVKFGIILFQDWGGQCSPEVISNRVKNLTGLTFNKNNQHTADAIGMGLSLHGKFGR